MENIGNNGETTNSLASSTFSRLGYEKLYGRGISGLDRLTSFAADVMDNVSEIVAPQNDGEDGEDKDNNVKPSVHPREIETALDEKIVGHDVVTTKPKMPTTESLSATVKKAASSYMPSITSENTIMGFISSAAVPPPKTNVSYIPAQTSPPEKYQKEPINVGHQLGEVKAHVSVPSHERNPSQETSEVTEVASTLTPQSVNFSEEQRIPKLQIRNTNVKDSDMVTETKEPKSSSTIRGGAGGGSAVGGGGGVAALKARLAEERRRREEKESSGKDETSTSLSDHEIKSLPSQTKIDSTSFVRTNSVSEVSQTSTATILQTSNASNVENDLPSNYAAHMADAKRLQSPECASLERASTTSNDKLPTQHITANENNTTYMSESMQSALELLMRSQKLFGKKESLIDFQREMTEATAAETIERFVRNFDKLLNEERLQSEAAIRNAYDRGNAEARGSIDKVQKTQLEEQVSMCD